MAVQGELSVCESMQHFGGDIAIVAYFRGKGMKREEGRVVGLCALGFRAAVRQSRWATV